jgi:nitroreductase
MNPLEPLLNRRSYSRSKLEHPAPSDEQLRQLFDLVMTTPDHGNLKPWRILVARGNKMQELADATLVMYQKQSLTGELKEKAYRSAREIAETPMMIIMISDFKVGHKVSLWDQQLCGGAAAQNLMTGLHLMGFGGFWYTFLVNEELKPLLGMQKADQIIAAISVGTPKARFVRKMKRKAPDKYCYEWLGFNEQPAALFDKKQK